MYFSRLYQAHNDMHLTWMWFLFFHIPEVVLSPQWPNWCTTGEILLILPFVQMHLIVRWDRSGLDDNDNDVCTFLKRIFKLLTIFVSLVNLAQFFLDDVDFAFICLYNQQTWNYVAPVGAKLEQVSKSTRFTSESQTCHSLWKKSLSQVIEFKYLRGERAGLLFSPLGGDIEQ